MASDHDRAMREDARAALKRLCELHGFPEAAEVLERSCDGGVVTLSPELAEYRDGREEAIEALKEAFEADRHPIIVIDEIAPGRRGC